MGNRSKKAEDGKKAELSLQELRQQQKEKYKAFESDPNAKQQEAYQRPASIADGGKSDQGGGGWFGGLFGGGSSSSGGGGGRYGGRGDKPERRGPNIKTIGDLPKPVQRGG